MGLSRDNFPNPVLSGLVLWLSWVEGLGLQKCHFLRTGAAHLGLWHLLCLLPREVSFLERGTSEAAGKGPSRSSRGGGVSLRQALGEGGLCRDKTKKGRPGVSAQQLRAHPALAEDQEFDPQHPHWLVPMAINSSFLRVHLCFLRVPALMCTDPPHPPT